jgi:hypothetical protein
MLVLRCDPYWDLTDFVKREQILSMDCRAQGNSKLSEIILNRLSL